jgi:murein DD-endopeptidase MepM/ murein hydrolase activator NlpD
MNRAFILMWIRFASVTCVGALVACAAAVVAARPNTPLTIAASAAASALPPGGVSLLMVHASQPLDAVEGYGLGKPVRFWHDADATKWFGLVSAGLDAKPGPYPVAITGRGPTGTTSVTLSLRVQPKTFETRHRKVDPQFVNPPVAEAERIASEQKLMADLFSQVSKERHWRGHFEMPVPGSPSSSFGRLSVMNGQPRGRHQGADFRAATGTPVLAPNAGRVVLAADLYFSGNTVIIDHGLGMFSLLAHLSRIAVTPGASVSRGELLGESGSTGRVTGPHLHWALRLGDASVDPLALMNAVAALGEERSR